MFFKLIIQIIDTWLYTYIYIYIYTQYPSLRDFEIWARESWLQADWLLTVNIRSRNKHNNKNDHNISCIDSISVIIVVWLLVTLVDPRRRRRLAVIIVVWLLVSSIMVIGYCSKVVVWLSVSSIVDPRRRRRWRASAPARRGAPGAHLRSVSEISSCFCVPRPWHIEIRHRVKKTSTINLFGFETLKLKIRRLKLWKPTVTIMMVIMVSIVIVIEVMMFYIVMVKMIYTV